jgi:succinyl-diaminopimelate desuccinylase
MTSSSDKRTASILELTRALVRQPSQAGTTGSLQALEVASSWLRDHGLETRFLHRRDRPVALVGSVPSAGSGPILCLNACADTAPVENPKAWSMPPFGGEIVDGWMYGRGAADSKVAVAIFCHLLLDWSATDADGQLVLLFDADEHTGRFRGVQQFVAEYPPIDAVMIGYPGLDAIRDGARGFWRATVTVFGTEEHSGSSHVVRSNAVVRGSELVRRLAAARLPGNDPVLGLPPQLTVTAIEGGRGFSTVPDRCRVRIDTRLTEDWPAEAARALVTETVELLDRELPGSQLSRLHEWEGWPAYRLREGEAVLAALRGGVHEALGRDVPTKPSGPSNIGNYLSTLSVPATCGFGVRYRGVHGVDECFEVASVASVARAYDLAVHRFFNDLGVSVTQARASDPAR